MGFIKVDPKQSKAVVPLLVILVGAIAVTILRINPGPAASAPANAANSKVNSTPSGAVVNASYDPSRNPFIKPELISAAIKSMKSAIGEPSPAELMKSFEKRKHYPDTPLNTKPLKWHSPVVNVSPMPIPSVGEKTAVKEPQKPKPSFALLATIGNEGGFSAVVKSDGSNERVVEVGDVLDGGYRVKQIEADRAVLTDGRDIVIAKRPNS